MKDQKSDRQTGSPQGEPVFLAIGKIGRPHGVLGEVYFDIYTDFPERIKPNTQVFLGDAHSPLQIRKRRVQNHRLLLKFDGYDTPEAVGELRNQVLYVHTADLPPLAEGEYYHHQILGLSAIAEDGQPLGKVTEILTTGSNDVYVVRPESGPEILLPATEEVILEIDLGDGTMTVHLLPGLLPGT